MIFVSRFCEMPTNNFIESSFWNFDALFQPQQHPARDAHDTFFISGSWPIDILFTFWTSRNTSKFKLCINEVKYTNDGQRNKQLFIVVCAVIMWLWNFDCRSKICTRISRRLFGACQESTFGRRIWFTRVRSFKVTDWKRWILQCKTK